MENEFTAEKMRFTHRAREGTAKEAFRKKEKLESSMALQGP